MNEKAENYRGRLAKYMGHEIVLECNDFSVSKTKTGLLCMLLKNPSVKKVRGRMTPKDMTLSHIWVIVPKESPFLKYFMFIRRLRIEGRVFEYMYKDGTMQAGVRASDISVAKYRKDITKRFSGHVSLKNLEKVAREIERRQNEADFIQ